MFVSSLPFPKKSKTFNLILTPTWTRPTNSSRHFPGQTSTELQPSDSPTTKPLTCPTPRFHHQLSYIPSSSWTCLRPLPTSFQHSLSFHCKVDLDFQKLLGRSFTTTRSTQAVLVRTPSPKQEALLPQKVPSPTRENNPRVNPRAPTQIDPLIKLSMVEDIMANLIQDP